MSSQVAILHSAIDVDEKAEALEARFQLFVATHREQAVRMAWRLVAGDAGAAEDVVQDALLNAYKALPRFRGDSSLKTWFYRILVRRAANHRRWRGLRTRWHTDDAQEPCDPNPAAASDPLVQRRIEDALGQLTQRQREAFVLVHLEQWTVLEAAEIAGTRPGTLKSHLHRALLKLRADLGDLRADAEGEQKP